MEKIEFKQVRDFGEVLNASILFIKENFKPLFFSLLLIAGPFVLVASVLPVLINLRFTGEVVGSTDFVQQLGTSTLINFLSFLVGSVMIVGVIYEYILLYVQGDLQVIRTNDVWKAVRNDFFLILGNMLATSLIYVFGVGILSAIIISIFAQMGIFMTIVGFLFTMGMWMYSSIPASILLVLNLHERIGFFDAFYRSFVLTKGHWWETFGLLFVCGIFMMVIMIGCLVPFGIYSFSSNLLTNPGSSVTLTVVFGILTSILFTLSMVFGFGIYLTVTAFQYFSLLERKDATGLLERIQNIGAPESETSKTDFYESEEETH